MPPKITIAPEWVGKGQLLMEGLAEEIAALWHACQHVEGSPAPGGQLDIPSLNRVLNALRRPLTTIRTIDLEALKKSDHHAYEALEKTTDYHVLRGLIGPRNNAVHHPEVIDMDVSRAVGPGPNYAIFPKWKPRSEVPISVFSFRSDFKAAYANSYELAVGGRQLLDPLLDAYKLLDDVAGLAPRDVDGRYMGFPLPPREFLAPFDYSRLHPDWPSSEEYDENLRIRLGSQLPGGVERVVEGFMRTADGVVLLGQTRVYATTTVRFLELVDQVARDIAAGYPYRVGDGGLVSADLKVASASPTEPNADLVTGSGLVDHTDDMDRTPWAGWWKLCQDDAGYYATVRRPQ